MVPGKINKSLCIVAFLFSFASYMPISAGTAFTPYCQKALLDILQFNSLKAEQFLALEQKSNPGNLYIPYIRNYALFLKIVFDESPTDWDDYKRTIEFNKQLFENKNEATPDKLILYSEINLQTSVIFAKFNDKVNALKYLYASEKLFADYLKLYPQHTDKQKLLPVLILLNTYLPTIIKKFTPLKFREANAFLLIENYCKSVANDSVKFLEGKILESFLYYQFGTNKKESFEHVKQIQLANPQNPLINLVYLLSASRVGNSGSIECSKIIENMGTNENLPVFYKFIIAENRLNTNRGGLSEFQEFVSEYKGLNYKKTALLKLGYCFLLKGDTLKYLEYLKRVSSEGVALNDADKYSNRIASNTAIPNIYLLKATLLFDGGLYAKARAILLHINTKQSLKTTTDRVEYFYRFARINQEEGDANSAITYFELVIKYGSGLSNYFAANSALQLAEIYETQQRLNQAKNYYLICLKLNKYGYVSSIETKAKAGLERINR